MTKQTLLVTGASGQLGQRVLELLLEKGETSIIATTRSPEKLADFAQKGVDIRYADFDDTESLATAFAGADRLLLISTDELGVPGKRVKQHTAAVEQAEKAGVKHVVYTSIVEPTNTPVMIASDHAATEDALAKSNMGWTISRNNLYMDLLLGSLPRALASGTLYSAAADGKAAYVTREDCAQFAAAALADSFEGQWVLNVTGPSALSQGDIAEIASSVLGQKITYQPIPLEALIGGMVDAGLPQPMAESYASFDAGIAEDKCSGVSNAIEDLTGVKPMGLADFLKANQAILTQNA